MRRTSQRDPTTSTVASNATKQLPTGWEKKFRPILKLLADFCHRQCPNPTEQSRMAVLTDFFKRSLPKSTITLNLL